MFCGHIQVGFWPEMFMKVWIGKIKRNQSHRKKKSRQKLTDKNNKSHLMIAKKRQNI